MNAYEAGTEWGTNAGCGAELSDAQLDELFASLPRNSLVRFWAFQGTIATNFTTHQLDWGPLDRVFAAVASYSQRLIVVLSGQGSGCDGGHWQDPSWYDGGFSRCSMTLNDRRQRLTPLSYWDYLQALVSRYASSPALGMWEPMSEAEASTCPPNISPSIAVDIRHVPMRPPPPRLCAISLTQLVAKSTPWIRNTSSRVVSWAAGDVGRLQRLPVRLG